MINTFMSMLYKIILIAALLLLAIALWNKCLELFGWTLTWVTYPPKRILELSAILIVFAIFLLLRQIREQLKK